MRRVTLQIDLHDGACTHGGAPLVRAPWGMATSAFDRTRVDAELTIAKLAERQHGVLARPQLTAAGMSAAAIDWQIRRRRLHVLHRGVYRSGPLPQPRSRLMAAVLVCGETAHLSHTTAAALLGLLPSGTTDRIDVTASRNRRAPAWIRLHRVRRLDLDETTTCEGLRITGPARTLLDLAATASTGDVEHALIEALRRRLTDRAGISALLDRHAFRAGSRLLRALVERAANPQLTRSEAERRLREVIRLAELPGPLMNVHVHGYQVDAHWPKERVVVEVDGYAVHSSHAAFERDRRRDAELAAAGLTVIRLTWHQLARRPLAVAARLGAILAGVNRR